MRTTELHTRRRRRRRVILGVIVLVFALALPVPWLHVVSETPPATAWRLDGRLHIDGQPVAPEGRWSWLAVGRPKLVGEILLEAITDRGPDATDLRQGLPTRRPALSEPAAAAVGLRHAGRELPLGVLVAVSGPTREGLPQSAIVVSVDGVALTDREAWNYAAARREGLAPEAAGPTAAVDVATGDLTFTLADGRRFTAPGPDLPYQRVSILDTAPDDLEVAITLPFTSWLPVEWFRNLSVGSSHGMMVALMTYADASGQDLAQGRHIAGTGGIEGDGTVTRIGGLASKARAAHRSGADVLLIPAIQQHALDPDDLPGTTVVPVHTLQEAIDWLTQPAA